MTLKDMLPYMYASFFAVWILVPILKSQVLPKLLMCIPRGSANKGPCAVCSLTSPPLVVSANRAGTSDAGCTGDIVMALTVAAGRSARI